MGRRRRKTKEMKPKTTLAFLTLVAGGFIAFLLLGTGALVLERISYFWTESLTHLIVAGTYDVIRFFILCVFIIAAYLFYTSTIGESKSKGTRTATKSVSEPTDKEDVLVEEGEEDPFEGVNDQHPH